MSTCKVDPNRFRAMGWLASHYGSHIGRFSCLLMRLIELEDVALGRE